MHTYLWASEASTLVSEVEVGAAAVALAAWRLESNQLLGLPESALETSAPFLLGTGMATAAEVPHLAVPAAPVEHASLL
jgi:hypothetical protein